MTGTINVLAAAIAIWGVMPSAIGEGLVCACMMDMYSALTCGAAVYIIGEDIRLNLPDLNDYFNREGITHSFMTTQVGCQFAMNFDNHSLLHLSDRKSVV